MVCDNCNIPTLNPYCHHYCAESHGLAGSKPKRKQTSLARNIPSKKNMSNIKTALCPNVARCWLNKYGTARPFGVPSWLVCQSMRSKRVRV